MGVNDSYVWGLIFLTFGGKGFLRLRVSYLSFGVRESYVWELVYYVWRLRILTFRGQFSYVWPSGIPTFRGYRFLRLRVRDSDVKGVRDPYVWGFVFLLLVVGDSYIWGLVLFRFGG